MAGSSSEPIQSADNLQMATNGDVSLRQQKRLNVPHMATTNRRKSRLNETLRECNRLMVIVALIAAALIGISGRALASGQQGE